MAAHVSTTMPRRGAAFVLAMLGAAGCGDATSAIDAAAYDAPAPDAFALPPGFGPLVALPLLPDYNHSSETTVAAHGDDVVIVSINQKYDSADSFTYDNLGPDDEFRRVAFSVSHDRGDSYQPVFHLGLPETTDPVVRVSPDGTFWATLLHPSLNGSTTLAQSTDGGDTWTPVRTDLATIDKPWLAIDASEPAVYIGGSFAFYKLAPDGSTLASTSARDGMIAAWAGDGRALFLRTAFWVESWDGVSDPTILGDPLPAGDLPRVTTVAAGAIGMTADGGEWTIRAMRSTGATAVVVRVRRLPEDPGDDIALTDDGDVVFLPSGALDEYGRLHAIWYDSTGPTGMLMYSHSLSDDVTGAYTTPVVVDPNACPGDGWYPYLQADPEPKPDQPGGRRLREYIDITAVGGRAHLVWTHAPGPPSRVYTTYVDYE